MTRRGTSVWWLITFSRSMGRSGDGVCWLLCGEGKSGKVRVLVHCWSLHGQSWALTSLTASRRRSISTVYLFIFSLWRFAGMLWPLCYKVFIFFGVHPDRARLRFKSSSYRLSFSAEFVWLHFPSKMSLNMIFTPPVPNTKVTLLI